MPRRMIHGRQLALMLVAAFLIQLTVPLVRIAVTYEALAMGLSGSNAGALAAAFALVPVFLAVPFGRFNDRGYLGLSVLAGTLIMALAVALLVLAPMSLWVLFVGVAVLGIGQTLHYSGLQIVIAHSSTRMHRDAILGNYLLATSLGDATAPLFVSLSGSNDPATVGQFLLLAGVVSVSLLLVVSVILFRMVGRVKPAGDGAPMPLGTLLRTPGLFWIIVAGSVCATTQDLMLVYLPVMGLARQIDLATVGLLLSSVSLASVAARASFGFLVRLLGRTRLMLAAAVLAATALLVMAAPIPVWAMFVVLPITGFALGSGGTVTLALALAGAPRGTRATTMALRQLGNRIGLFALPIGYGVIGALFGVGAIFIGMGAMLSGTTAMAMRRKLPE